MSGHTAGPWEYRRTDEYDAEFPYEIMGPWQGRHRLWIGGAQTTEDARLIAAAPELLEALESAISQMDTAGDCIEAGRYDEALLHVRSLMRGRRAAIAKATGAQP